MIAYTTEKVLAELGSYGSNAKRLTVTSWNSRPAKLDLRTWRTEEEPAQPGKGMTLSDEEAKTLLAALQEYFDAKAAAGASA